jgi:SAM-dependent methyltransferase
LGVLLPDCLLFRFYEVSYAAILGITLEWRQAAAFPNFISYLSASFDSGERTRISGLLEAYRTTRSPAVKLGPLLREVNGIDNWRPQTMVDFGAGSGTVAAYIAFHLPSLRQIWAVEPDSRALMTSLFANTDGAQLIHCTDVSQLPLSAQKYDLVLSIDTLHHLRTAEQKPALELLASSLNDGGMIYVHEDSWACVNNESDEQTEPIDQEFCSASTDEKRSVFKRNDFWSNGWCYGRNDLFVDASSYRSIQDWQLLMRSVGLRIIEVGNKGFDSARLHGVPSGWIIAGK